jgi:hypothetical protein
LNDLFNQGYQPGIISKQLGYSLRKKLIYEESADEEVILNLLADLIEVPASHDPEKYLEIALLRSRPKNMINQAHQTETPAHEESVFITSISETKEEVKTIIDKPSVELQPDSNQDVSPIPIAKMDDELWAKVLNALKHKHNTLYGVIRMANPSFDSNGKLDLVFAFEFHKKRISEANNKKALADVIKDLTDKDVIIECHFNKNATPYHPKKVEPAIKAKPDDISTISNIFNGAELLES